MRTFRYRHRLAIDMRSVRDREHRAVIQDALNRCAFPLMRIRRRTMKRVPVGVADLSRYAAELDAKTGHGHVHNGREHGHLLGEPEPEPSAAVHRGESPSFRARALGLYWLPTTTYPAGRIELDVGVMRDRPLAQEVLMAELAHAVDYGAMTDAQRLQVMGLFEFSGSGIRPEGWFEEHGERDYWRWRGERWMGLFMAAYAPELARPLEVRQPWEWSYDAADTSAVRVILR